MASREIVLWLDERWYDALERHLQGETLQDKLEDYLDELCNQLPSHEYEQISAEIYQESMARQAEREASRRFAVFRIRENGERRCCLVDEHIDLLAAARALRSYIRSESTAGFRSYYAAAREISGREFSRYVQERMENTGRVVGAFDIDLDGGTFADLNQGEWYVYTLRDVCTAAYHANRRSQESSAKRTEHLLNYLRGKTLPQQGYYPKGYLTFGERELRPEDIAFADEICEEDGRLDFYLESFDGLDEVLGTHVCTEENDDYLNLYADYDLVHGTVTDTLLIILHRGDGTDEQHEYPLSTEEQALLLPKMEEYCQERTGMSLADYRSQYLAQGEKAQGMGTEPTM